MVRAALLRRAENPGAAAAEEAKPDPRLLAACCWLFRLLLLLNSILLVLIGINLPRAGIPGWPLVCSALLLLLTEPAIRWFRSLEK